MGGGSHTSQNNVTKRSTSYSADKSTVVGGEGNGYDKESAGACLITFKASIRMATASVAAGNTFVLVHGDGDLQLISSGKRIGSYSGNRLQMLEQCMAGGYTYHGKINSVRREGSSVVANCTVTGMGPV